VFLYTRFPSLTSYLVLVEYVIFPVLEMIKQDVRMINSRGDERKIETEVF
jgi:hypothetical protein